jgi:hypothetical protein
MALSFSVPDTELSLTLHNRRAEVVDNIFTGTPFLNALREHGGVNSESGGLQLVEPLLMSKNTTAGSFSGFDILDTTPQNNETSTIDEWRLLYVTISISAEEEAKNKGPGRLINLTNQKIDDATMTLRDLLNIQLIGAQPAAGSKDMASISEIIDEAPGADPPRTASIGGIGNANTWWRNQATAGGAFTVADMNTMWNDCSDGVDPPTFIFTDQTRFEYYENSQVGQIRYSNTRSADAGFENLLYKTAPIYWDAQINSTNADEMYFINTKYLKLYIHNEMDFKTTDFIEPDNQAAKTAKILFMGALKSNNRRRLGTLHGITAPA